MFSNIANINNFISTQLNSFKYSYVTQTIQLRHIVDEFYVLIINTDNPF